MGKQLDAEFERLEKQLAHDRLLREEEETRAVLDDVMRAVALATETSAYMFGRSKLGEARKEAGLDSGEPNPEDLMERVRKVLVELTAPGQRLRLRFGEEHELSRSYKFLLDAMHASLAAEAEALLAGADRTEAGDLSSAAGQKVKEFAAVCNQYAGVRLSRPG